MNRRLPSLLLAIGLLGVIFVTRYANVVLPPAIRGDFPVGVLMGVFLGTEMLGAMMMIRQRRNSACRSRIV